MRKIKDVYTINDGFFNTLNRLDNAAYLRLFNDMDPTLLDTYFLYNWGERYIAPIVAITSVPIASELILLTHYDSWIRKKNALDINYDVSKPYDMTLNATTERDFTSNVTSDIIDNDIVFGFDDNVNGHNDSKSTRDSNRDITNNESTNRTQRRVGNLGQKDISDLIQKELKLRTITLIKLVMVDLKNYFTVDIY